MLILNADDTRASLPIATAIAAVRRAYIESSAGRVMMPERLHVSISEHDASMLVMPAYVRSASGEAPALAVKVVSVFPHNVSRGTATINGAVMVINAETGECLAILDGAAITAIRTGAGAAVATQLLSTNDASVLAVFGAGAQARTQVTAVCAVRRITSVRIFSRTPAKAVSLIDYLRSAGDIASNIRAADSPREAVRDADIVCTATTSSAPLFADSDLKPGAHINAIGAYRRDMCEIPRETVCRARVFVDAMNAALTEAGDITQPIEAGLIDRTHIVGEIGEALAGRIVSRENESQITLFKSVGMAAQDAVAAMAAYTTAIENKIGQVVRW